MTGDNNIYTDNIAIATKIFEEHGDFIYNVIRYKTTDKSLVEDLYQDFFLALAANPVTLKDSELKAYLYRAIINDIQDATRRIKRYKNLLNKYVEIRQFPVNNSSLKNASTVEDRVETILKDAWGRLSPKETNAISLRYLEGYSISEIASKMQVKPASVSRYICIGLKKLRQCLDSTEEEKT